MNRGRTLRLYSGLGAALLLGCLVLANTIASRTWVRLDFSSGRLYSLSSGSKRVLGTLKKPIEVRVFFSKRLPPEYEARRQYLGDILKEYEDASGGKVKPKFIDVDSAAEAKREAMTKGIAPLEFNVVSDERFEVRQGFMGLILQYEDKSEVIPVIANTEGLEYDLTSRILQLTRKKKRVAFLSSHGALAPEGLHPRLREMLERNYELKPADLSAKDVPDADAWILLGPQETLKKEELAALDSFLASGKPMVLALDSRKADMRGFLSTPLKTGIEDWLAKFGLALGKNYVLDLQNKPVQVSQNRGWLTFTNVVKYPLFLVADDLDKEHPVTRHLKALTLPMASPLEIGGAASQAVKTLTRSSKLSWESKAWSRGVAHSISPLQRIEPAKEDKRGPFNLMVELSGASLPGLPAGARLLVVGTSQFAHPEMAVDDTGPALLLNLIDWMGLDDDLIGIRSKGVFFRPLREIDSGRKRAVRWANMLGPSLLVVLFGLMRIKRRAAARRARTDRYRAAA